jgi:hypothetical protein
MAGATSALEIVGKPYDLDQLAAAVRTAIVRTGRSVAPPQ